MESLDETFSASVYDEKALPQVHVSSETGDSEDHSTNRPNSRRRNFFLLSWWQEVLACVAAVAAFFALFTTLKIYAHKTVPDLPSGLSLNTILSLYAIVLEGAVLLIVAEGLGQLKWVWLSDNREKPIGVLASYDNATRGTARGALTLIWKLKLSHLLSSAGAVIVILTLAVDPLTQQMVHYYDCEVKTTRINATLPRTNYYMQTDDRGAKHRGPTLQTIGVPVQAQINSALYNPDLAPDVTCRSGNCTWSKEYSTVGYCRSCQDITNQLVFTNTSSVLADGRQIENITTSLQYLGASMFSDDGAKQLCAMGPSYGSDAINAPSNFPMGWTWLDFILAKDVRGRVDPATEQDWTDCNSSPAMKTWKCQGYGASRCTFYPCVKTYNASVKSGRLVETLKDTASDWGHSSDKDQAATIPMAMLDSQCISADERRNLTDLGYNLDNSTRWVAYNMTNSPFDDIGNVFPRSMILKGCMYMIDPKFGDSLQTYLKSYLTGNVSSAAKFGTVGQLNGPQSIQYIYNFGEVSFDRMDQFTGNISTVLTNAIRETGLANFSDPATGDEYPHQTCVAVRWPYLAFPAALTTFAVVFFVLMLVKTRPTGDRPEIWKSSSLPLLYQSLARGESGSDADGNDAVTDLRDMEALAKTRTVTFKGLMRNVARGVVRDVIDKGGEV